MSAPAGTVEPAIETHRRQERTRDAGYEAAIERGDLSPAADERRSAAVPVEDTKTACQTRKSTVAIFVAMLCMERLIGVEAA